jgi:hypothetical protein
MSIETHTAARDPRTALVREKYFSLRPKPLERWLWQQGLPQAAERVFWVHWEEGMKAGDWCSQIPLRLVASLCCVDPSTVTRAYQVLKKLDLIRREDPGRDPGNPFQQATAITEVRIPRELLTELSRAPNRPQRRLDEEGGDQRHAATPTRAPATSRAGEAVSGSQATDVARPAIAAGPPADRNMIGKAIGKLSDAERARFTAASRACASHLEFEANTRLDPEERAAVLGVLASFARTKTTPIPTAVAEGRRSQVATRRQISPLEAARLRRSLLELLPRSAAAETLREILWSMEEGALNRYEIPLAINTALKLVREGRWTRPNRMPPNWRGSRAAAETCSAA